MDKIDRRFILSQNKPETMFLLTNERIVFNSLQKRLI